MAEYWKISKKQEYDIFQKSRIRWVAEGDDNTIFYHVVVNWRMRENIIKALWIGDRWSKIPLEIKEEVKQFFDNKFVEEGGPKFFLNELPFYQINHQDNELLSRQFSKDEIREAVWSCDGNKSPRPHGSSLTLIKRCWSFLKIDIMKMMLDFHRNGVLPMGVNAAFITFIPKVRKSSIVR